MLNRPKALVVVVVIAFIINGLLFYRYQHNLAEASTAGPSLGAAEPSAVATATPTSFAVPAGQKESSSAKGADGKKRGILATALETLGLDRSLSSPQGSSQIPYIPLSHLSASSPQETRNAQADTNPTETPPTEEVAPASNHTVDKPAVDEAAPAQSGPASVSDQKEEAAPRERPRDTSRIVPPAPDDSTESADDAAPKGALRETAPEKETSPKKESIGGEAAPPELPSDEKLDLPSAPSEQPGPPLAPKSQAQCTDGGFVVFGFKNEDECLRFVTPRGESEPAKGQKD